MNHAFLIPMLLGLVVAVPVHADTISPALTWDGGSDLPHWTNSVPPPAAFSLSIAGKAAVTVGTALDLHPVIHPIVTGR